MSIHIADLFVQASRCICVPYYCDGIDDIVQDTKKSSGSLGDPVPLNV